MTKSLESNCHKSKTDAPNTFRTPISLVRCSATKEARPNKPKQEMKMASTANTVERLAMRSSSPNFLAYSSSVNWYSKELGEELELKPVGPNQS